MVGGPAHGPRVDVVQLAACTRARALVALAILKELLQVLAISHRRRDGALVSRRDERQPPQDGGDGNDLDDGPWLWLIQLLRSALACLPPPGGGVPVDQNFKFAHSLHFVCNWCALCFHTVSALHKLPRVFTCPAHSRRGNRSWHSCSPSVPTCHFYPSHPSSPGYGTEAPY